MSGEADLPPNKGSGSLLSFRFGFRLAASNGPLLNVSALLSTDSPPVVLGLRGSGPNGCLPKGSLSVRCPLREGARSLPVGVLRPLLVDGRLPLLAGGVGKGGKAQSKLAGRSGLGEVALTRGGGMVAFRVVGGRDALLLLPERAERKLSAGEAGESDRGYIGAR